MPLSSHFPRRKGGQVRKNLPLKASPVGDPGESILVNLQCKRRLR
jgi:hypothetical protein